MRGSQPESTRDYIKKGIIPAHAGLTSLRTSLAKRPGDHPRACGAHTARSMARRAIWGSSPRMRGSPTDTTGAVGRCGIIPAHAGLTLTRSSLRATFWDHPRACGAHLLDVFFSHPRPGSSPRMRGSHTVHLGTSCWLGIIPAHAGLTRSQWKMSSASGDHPRACGAHVLF